MSILLYKTLVLRTKLIFKIPVTAKLGLLKTLLIMQIKLNKEKYSEEIKNNRDRIDIKDVVYIFI